MLDVGDVPFICWAAGAMHKTHKPPSDHKSVPRQQPLTEDKGKARHGSTELANVLGQNDEAYREALFKIMANIHQGMVADDGLDGIFDTSIRAVGGTTPSTDGRPVRPAGLAACKRDVR